MTLWKRQNYGDSKKTAWWLVMGEGGGCERQSQRLFRAVRTVFMIP